MSRIFEALRRSELGRNGQTQAEGSGRNSRLQELLTSLEKQPLGKKSSEKDSASLPETQRGQLDFVTTCHVRPHDSIVADHPHHIGSEKFRVLCHRLRQLRHQRTLSSILVTSAIPREGKTVVALNLATTLAYSSSRVLLLDTDMRRSGIREILGLPRTPGLVDFLEGRAEWMAALKKIEPLGIYCLSAGETANNPVELLQSQRMQDLMTSLAARFEWVIVDSPPIHPFADAHCLAGLTDTILLVVRCGLAPRDTLQQGLTALSGTSIAGVVLNGSTVSDSDPYYYYYARSGSSKKKARGASSDPDSKTSVPSSSSQQGTLA